MILLIFLARQRFSNLPIATLEDAIKDLYSWELPTGISVSKKVDALSTQYRLPKKFFFWLEANYLNLELISNNIERQVED